MRRSIRRALLLMLVAGIAAACSNNNNSTPTGPTTLPTVLTETFSGTLSKNSAFTHPFVVSDAGDVSVFLTESVDASNPNNTIPIGVSLGTWNGTSCAIVIANDNVAQGSSITGRATAAGNLCVRVYDVGFVPGSANYELLIDHY
ncbi:MAG: hypothetical protein DMF87_25285 [Acidobacteria bacterium]|nr:MAG: hypothetical protein DMF87_25285 [Acidobacteriota bacterium]